jgi:hypothetical protein
VSYIRAFAFSQPARVPIPQTRYRFVSRMVEGAPGDMGVYALWRHDRLLYIGRAMGGGTTIQSRLLEHLKGQSCACSREATHYSWEIVLQPAVRELELLQEHRREAGELPPCNLHATS